MVNIKSIIGNIDTNLYIQNKNRVRIQYITKQTNEIIPTIIFILDGENCPPFVLKIHLFHFILFVYSVSVLPCFGKSLLIDEEKIESLLCS